MEEESEFLPRDYQIVLAEQAIESNKILYLPTGSGKTFISIMILKHFFPSLQRPYDEGGKRSVFLVNTVALVEQQAKVLKRHLPVDNVGEYSGDMNVDDWTKEHWLGEFRANEVMVMTAEILNQLLLRSFITFQQLAVIILDECHHAVEDHPMSQIMRQLEKCPAMEQPRVLGLSATLLNGTPKTLNRVKDEVKKLEITLHSTIATVNSWELVKKFSTKPREKIINYDSLSWKNDKITKIVDSMERLCQYFDFALEKPSESCRLKPGFRPLPKARKHFIKNLITQVPKQFTSLGSYGAFKTALAVSTTLHTIMLKSELSIMQLCLTSLLTSLALIRIELDSNMRYPSESERAIFETTPKVRLLLRLLKTHFQNCENRLDNQTDSARILVFVQERMTAKILSSILKNAARSEDFSFIKTSFMVGQTFDPINESWEAALVKKRNMDTVQRFRDGDLNVLVCSDVLEEGIDIPLCNMVIKFDEVLSYRSYIQSKGRARNRNSRFYLMIDTQSNNSMQGKVNFFNDIEQVLVKLLVGKTDERESPTEEELQDFYDSEVPPYETPTGAKVTLTSAISLVSGYTMASARDRFSQHIPTWGSKEHSSSFEVSIQLPKTASFQQLVVGQPMASLKLAKRAAALKMCVELHKAGELTDDLLLSEVKLSEENTAYLFPFWERETCSQKAGTKARIREYEPYKPICMKSNGFKDCFHLHAIRMVPGKECNMDKVTEFMHNLFNGNKSFALLSTKKLEEVGCFPVFFKFGEIQVHVEYKRSFTLNEKQIQGIQQYHAHMFIVEIPLVKPFMIFRQSEDLSHFLIAPIRKDSAALDWDTIYSIPNDGTKPLPSPESSLGRVIKPTHRAFSAQDFYIVCNVSKDVTAENQFPNLDYKNYCDYFRRKYSLEISQPTVPLLEVVCLTTNTDCMLPRSSRKCPNTFSDRYTTHFPMEMCVEKSCDASLLVQSVLLPTVLHRFERLLIANDLRIKISQETNIGAIDPPCGTAWAKLEWQDANFFNKELKECRPGTSQVCWKDKQPSKPTSTKQAQPSLLGSSLPEPLDIERDFETLAFSDIKDYVYFSNIKMNVASSPYRAQNKLTPKKPANSIVPNAKIHCLSLTDVLGPHPCHIYEAITAASSDDIVNYERFETLGDSFLKFAVSLFLFVRFPDMSEGHCTQIKGKLLGNQNLFYCAREKNLGGFLKVNKMVIWNTYVPPHFGIPDKLMEIIRKSPGKSRLLHKVNFSLEEKTHGFISQKKIDEFNNLEGIFCGEESVNSLVGWQKVNDKCVADCVESLIGCYLQKSGPRNALILLEWFGILPRYVNTEIRSRDLLTCKSLSPSRMGFTHIPGKKALEQKLNYTFKNPAILLEAVTHSSFPGSQRSYERLEFIGDAILDFLITSYIFEHSGRLTPGQLTDLRSALVNNITFACLTVRNDFHKSLLSASPALFHCVNQFVEFQESRHHLIDDEVLVLLEEDECKLAETVFVPKALGDIFEALAGAVFLDSGNSLETVWRVFYNLMKTEISAFSEKVPKQIVRRLFEAIPQGVEFRVPAQQTMTSMKLTQTMVSLSVSLLGKRKLYHGFGENKAQAKKSAAKLALRDLKNA